MQLHKAALIVQLLVIAVCSTAVHGTRLKAARPGLPVKGSCTCARAVHVMRTAHTYVKHAIAFVLSTFRVTGTGFHVGNRAHLSRVQCHQAVCSCGSLQASTFRLPLLRSSAACAPNVCCDNGRRRSRRYANFGHLAKEDA